MTAGADNIGFLGADDVRLFETLLTEIVNDARVHCALLVDQTGRLLCRVGAEIDFDDTTFASLASADFAASDQLALLLGEQDFSSLYHHGAERSMFLADVNGNAILAVLFDNRTLLGMVRIKTKSLIPRFAVALQNILQRGPSGPLVQIESDWAAEAESQLDRLLSD